MKVNFVIIGAQKSGTTSLAYQLSCHPKIVFSQEKEPHFFSKNKDWKQSLDEYHGLFSPAGDSLYGEASTTYTFFPDFGDVAHRLYEYNPAIKLIYVMRQPVERVFSQYRHELLRGSKIPGLTQTVLSDPRYVNRSRYGMQLQPYLDQFPREQILLLIFEEFISDPVATHKKIASFLGVDFAEFPDQVDTDARNVSSKIGKRNNFIKKLTRSRLGKMARKQMSPKLLNIGARLMHRNIDIQLEISLSLKRNLWMLLEDDVRKIENLMGRRITIWQDTYTS